MTTYPEKLPFLEPKVEVNHLRTLKHNRVCNFLEYHSGYTLNSIYYETQDIARDTYEDKQTIYK